MSMLNGWPLLCRDKFEKTLKQAGAELGQAQLKLELGCIMIKIYCHQHD